MMLLLVVGQAWGQEGEFFNSTTIEGVEVTFRIVDEEQKKCHLFSVDENAEGYVTIPEEANGYRVNNLDNYCFDGCSKITGVYFPKSIGEDYELTFDGSIFIGCSSLVRIDVDPENVMLWSPEGSNCLMDYGYVIFAGCKTSVIPDFTYGIYCRAFCDVSGLEQIEIPEGVGWIADYAFAMCHDLKSIVLPSTLERLDVGVFQDCKKLVSATINSPIIENYSSNLFSGCTNLSQVQLCDEIKIINHSSFRNCAKLTSIKLPESLERIYFDAFLNSGLKSINIPKNVSYIAADAFRGVEGYSAEEEVSDFLSEITVDSQNPNYDSRDNCNAIIRTSTNMLVVGGINTTIPESVEIIGSNAFAYCPITTMTIPKNVKSIQYYAFGESPISSIIFQGCPSSIDELAFDGVGTKTQPCAISVPSDFDFGDIDVNASYFKWKGGYFHLDRNLVPNMEVEPAVAFAGSQTPLTICLNNAGKVFDGYQFDVVLPEGVALAKNGDGFFYNLTDRYSGNMNVTIKKVADGHYRLLCFALSNVTIIGDEGPVIVLRLEMNDGITDDFEGKLTNINLSGADGINVVLDDVPFTISYSQKKLGDVNNDEVVTVTDVMVLVKSILGIVDSSFDARADVNRDGIISVSDVLALVELILNAPAMNIPSGAYLDTSDQLDLVETSKGWSISLQELNDFRACQMLVHVPEHSMISNIRLGENCMDHFLKIKPMDNGWYRLLVYSTNVDALAFGKGQLISLEVVGQKGEVELKDIQFVDSDFNTTVFPDVKAQVTGIAGVTNPENDSPTYSLHGIKTVMDSKGIYIKNGKKFINQ